MVEKYAENKEYIVEFTYRDSNKGFSFSLSDVNNFEEAARKTVKELRTRGIIIEKNMTGNIKNSEGECYKIFEKGWLIDTKTGKISNLEKKVD